MHAALLRKDAEEKSLEKYKHFTTEWSAFEDFARIQLSSRHGGASRSVVKSNNKLSVYQSTQDNIEKKQELVALDLSQVRARRIPSQQIWQDSLRETPPL